MAIYRMLREMAFDEQFVKATTTAYEATLIEFGLTDRTDALTEIVASKIITIANWASVIRSVFVSSR